MIFNSQTVYYNGEMRTPENISVIGVTRKNDPHFNWSLDPGKVKDFISIQSEILNDSF